MSQNNQLVDPGQPLLAISSGQFRMTGHFRMVTFKGYFLRIILMVVTFIFEANGLYDND